MKLWCAALLAAFELGCTATCLRDSDCIGDSVCFQDRCILVVRGDAGRAPAATGTGGSRAASESDAPGTQSPDGVGGASTDPRLNLDAATDADQTQAGE